MIRTQSKTIQIPEIVAQLSFYGPNVGRATSLGVSVFVEGRIDEIEGTKIPGPEKSPQLLAELILRANEVGGLKSLKTAIGQYTIGVQTQDSILCLRSQFSLQPLYYTENKASNRLTSFRGEQVPQLDADYFARFLIQSRGLQWDSPLTPLKGVKRLPPGYLVELRNGKASVDSFDRLSERICWDPSQKISEVAPILDRLVYSIISETIDSHPCPVGCELSGGLDSSYVNALVADKRQKGHAAIMYSYAERPSHRYSEHCAEVVAAAKGIDLRIAGVEEMVIPDLRELSTVRDEPNPMHWQGELFGPLLQSNFEERSLLFTGFGSDSVLLHLTEVLPFLLRTRRWKSFFAMSRAIGKTLDRSPVNLMWQSFLCILPLRIKRFLKRTCSKLKFNPFSVEDLVPLGPGSVLAPWMKPTMNHFLDDKPVEFGKLDFSYLPYANAVMGPYLDRARIKYVHPYCDSRLIRFVREQVSGHLIHDFNAPYKNLLRQAQIGRVPEEVRNRTKNEFHFDGFHAKVLRKNISFYRHLLSEPLPVGGDLIHQEQLLTAFDQLQFGVGSPSTYLLTRLIAYLVWWRNFTLSND